MGSEHDYQLMHILNVRGQLVIRGFLTLISWGKFPSEGWWIEEKIGIQDGSLFYIQTFKSPDEKSS